MVSPLPMMSSMASLASVMKLSVVEGTVAWEVGWVRCVVDGVVCVVGTLVSPLEPFRQPVMTHTVRTMAHTRIQYFFIISPPKFGIHN